MIEVFLYTTAAFFIRMVIIFTLMMKYYHWINKDSLLWKVTKYPFKVIAYAFFVLDIMFNYVMILWFFDLPAKWDETVTHRMARYLKTGNGWQMTFAKMMRKILNYSDAGHL